MVAELRERDDPMSGVPGATDQSPGRRAEDQARGKPAPQRFLVTGDERLRERPEGVAEARVNRPCGRGRLQADELARVVEEIGPERLAPKRLTGGQPLARHS